MSKYRRMTFEDRIRLESLLENKKSVKHIALRLRLHKSTIYRELARTRHQGHYTSLSANARAEWFKLKCRRKSLVVGSMKRIVEKKLKAGWSPDEISMRLKKEGRSCVSHETIYRHLRADHKRGGELWRLLRRQTRQRRKRFPRLNAHRQASYYRNISKRPQEAALRTKRGHWERDTMFGKDKASSLLVMIDRKTRYCKIKKLRKFSAHEVSLKTKEVLIDTDCFKTVTSDNGPEMRYALWPRWVQKKMYSCDPYQPNQRGSVENCIGLLRQYLPSSRDFRKLTHQQLRAIESKMNHRPRRVLDYRTPHEVFFRVKVALAS